MKTIIARRVGSSAGALFALVAITVAASATPFVAARATANTRAVTVDTGSGVLNVRSAPSVNSQKLRTIPNGTQVIIICHSRGEAFRGPYGLTTDLWNRVVGGGFVTDTMLNTGSNNPVVPPCAIQTPTAAMSSGRTMGQTVYVNTAEKGSSKWGAYEKWFQASADGFFPALTGDAKDLADSARAAGWTVVDTPQPRSIAVFQPAVEGAPPAGHVAWIDSVDPRPDGQYIHLQEMNVTGDAFNSWTSRYVKHARGMLYILLP